LIYIYIKIAVSNHSSTVYPPILVHKTGYSSKYKGAILL